MAGIALFVIRNKFSTTATVFFRLVAFFYVLLCCETTAITWAEELAAPVEAKQTKETGRLLYQKGNLAFKANRLKEAKRFYLQALEKEEIYEAECNLGRVLAELSEWPGAYYHLLICDEIFPTEIELQSARKRFRELSYQVRSQLIEQEALGARARLDHWRKQQSLASASEQEPLQEPVVAMAQQSTRALQLRNIKRRQKKRVVVSLVGVGIVSLAVSVPFFFDAAAKKKRSEEVRQDLIASDTNCLKGSEACSNLQNLLKSWDRSKNTARGLAIAGGATLMGAALIQLIWKIPKDRVSWQPLWVPSQAGTHLLGVRKRF